MLKGLGDLANLMKNAKEIQGKVESLKESLAQIEAEGLGGGGLVRVKGRGDGTVVSVTIDEELAKKGDRQMLEDLTLAAFNSFQQALADVRKEKMADLTGGLGLPQGMDFGL
jgi:nucleoid-associated protein EbfC